MDSNLLITIDGCRKGDRKSQKALYRHFYSYGMSICIRYAEDENAAISILNDAFMKVFGRIHKYKTDQAFKPWLRMVIINTAIDYVNKRNRLMKKEELQEARHISAQEDILSKIGYQELLELVRSLSDGYRAVFNLYVIDGFKHEEIAERLHISVGTSKSNLSKAKAKLREQIATNLSVQIHG